MTPPYEPRWLVVAFVISASIYPLSFVEGSMGIWLVGIAFQFLLGALAAAVVGGVASDRGRERLGLTRSGLSIWRQAGLVALGLAVLWALASLVPEPAEDLPVRPFAEGPPGHVALFISLVLFPAFFEELFFRGALQSMLTKRWGFVTAAFVASALFAIFHAYAGPHVVLITFVMGLCLATITRRARSIYPAMVVHAINNGFVFASQML